MAGLGDLPLTSSVNLGNVTFSQGSCGEYMEPGVHDGRDTQFGVRGTGSYHWLSHLPLASIFPSVNGGIIIE